MSEPLRVLIVEDNDDHARLACEFLHFSGEFVTEVAVDLQTLWRKLAAGRYDVVALDYNLPDGNGLKALQELQARSVDTAVVMVTGRGDERVAAQAIQSGALEYIVKTGDYLGMLAAVVQKAARTHALQVANRRSLEQIRYQALLLNNVHDAVVVWNLEGRISFWNRAAETLYGWEAAAWLDRPAAECYRALFDLPAPPEPAGREPALTERRGRRQSGDEVWVDANVTALEDSAGRAIGVMEVARDITGRKRLEHQVQAAQTQLAQAARLAAIGELASGVAHQISNPLTTIIAETQLLLRETPPQAPVRESLEAIERGGWRAQQAVQRLLDFSRPATSTLEPVDVNATVDHAVGLVGDLIQTVGAQLEVRLAEALPAVHGNSRQLEDLWVNLLLLARDGTDDGQAHVICVNSALTDAGRVEVVVADDGRPLTVADLDQVFEPDYTGSAIGRGTGLELSICREIVRQHGGSIRATGRDGHGVAFTVDFPTR